MQVQRDTLIILPNHIGDAIFSLASVSSLREKFPSCRIDVLINKTAAGIIEGESNINKIILVNPWWEEFWYKNKFLDTKDLFFSKE